MKPYEFGPSRALRVRWTLQELDVPFEAVVINLRVGEQRSSEFLKLNPAAKLPVLVDGDTVLTESAAFQSRLCPDRTLTTATPPPVSPWR